MRQIFLSNYSKTTLGKVLDVTESKLIEDFFSLVSLVVVWREQVLYVVLKVLHITHDL